MEKAESVYGFVKGKVESLMRKNPSDALTSHQRATLAKLRRGIGKSPGATPEVWEVTLSDLPEGLASKSGEPTKEEYAIHTALTLFALHQQARNEKMSVKGSSFGSAVSRLRNDINDKAIKRRFDAVITAVSITEVTRHAQGLIQLLKASNISLDYPKFAQDLYWFQWPDSRDKVRLRWGQDFYRVREPKTDDTKQGGKK
jgi:CRISPR system Cascade subunit CasB